MKRTRRARRACYEADATQELDVLCAVDHQFAAVEQHHLVREHHLAGGVDGDVAIHIHTLAKGHIHGVADRQTFHGRQGIHPKRKARRHARQVAQA